MLPLAMARTAGGPPYTNARTRRGRTTRAHPAWAHYTKKEGTPGLTYAGSRAPPHTNSPPDADAPPDHMATADLGTRSPIAD